MNLTELNDYIKECIKSGELRSNEDIHRFHRILRFYGVESGDLEASDMLTMILDKPEDFKCSNRIIKKWTKQKSISDVFSTIVKICKLPKVKEYLGVRFKETVSGYESYIKELQDIINSSIEDKTLLKKEDLVCELDLEADNNSEVYSHNDDYNCIINSNINNKQEHVYTDVLKILYIVEYMKRFEENKVISMFVDMIQDEIERSINMNTSKLSYFINHMKRFDDDKIIMMFADMLNDIL